MVHELKKEKVPNVCHTHCDLIGVADEAKTNFLFNFTSATPFNHYPCLLVLCVKIPEAVSKYYMQKNGVEGSDDRMVKLISLAADQFLARTIHESHQLYLLRTSVNPSTKKTSGGKRKREEASSAEIKDIPALFQTEDLQMALASQGIHIMAKKKS